MANPNQQTPGARAAITAAARERRELKFARRRTLLDLIVAGYAHEQVAERLGLSIKTVRREVNRLLAERAPESADQYVALQLARLQKAMLVVDLAMDDRDLGAIPALATLLGQFDRYHGLAARLAANPLRIGAGEGHDSAPKALESDGRLPELQTAATVCARHD